MSNQEKPEYFGIVLAIAIVTTAIGVGLMALGVWTGIFMIIGSVYAWYLIGKDIVKHSNEKVLQS